MDSPSNCRIATTELQRDISNIIKIFFYLVLVILVFLAISSGVTKVLLMPQDVEFFSSFGFTDPILIAFGLAQILGGLMLAIPKVRIIGASVVAITFLISTLILVMSGNIPLTIVTLVFTGLLGFIAKFHGQFGRGKKTIDET